MATSRNKATPGGVAVRKSAMTKREIEWLKAYQAWVAKDAAPLAAWLLAAGPIHDDARAFLADLVLGKVKRPRGAKPKRTPAEERCIVAEVYAEREGSTHERAIAAVADRRGETEDAVRGIVDRHIKAGITYESWVVWGCPSWV